jgi:hypothetical protein
MQNDLSDDEFIPNKGGTFTFQSSETHLQIAHFGIWKQPKSSNLSFFSKKMTNLKFLIYS